MMTDREKQKNTNGEHELIDLRALIGHADTGGFTLDDILSEYGKGPSAPCPEIPTQEEPAPSLPLGENLVFFPGTPPRAAAQEGDEPSDEARHAPAPDEDPQPAEADEGGKENILLFPEEESLLSALVKGLTQKADDYADRMFQPDETISPEEIQRLERLIPGTDREEAPDPRFQRPPRRPEPVPQDLSPQELAKALGKGLKVMRLRMMGLFLLTAAGLYLTLAPLFPLPLPPALADSYSLQVWVCVALLGAGALLGGDVLIHGILRAFRLRLGMDTLAALSVVFCVADGVMLATERSQRDGVLPYCAVALVGLLLLVHGTYHKRCAQRLCCRTAAASRTPYRVTLDRGKWNARDTYTKWSGGSDGFGSQMQMDDGAQRIYRRVCPVLLLACVLLSGVASVGVGAPDRLLWGLSATFTAAAAFGGGLVYGRAFHKLSRRLAQSGGALAGWPGLADSGRGDRVILTDEDLFPPGYVELNGIKVFGDVSVEKVVGYTATLIRDSGSGLGKLFHNLLRSQGAIFRRAEELEYHEGGGVSAVIRGEQVLVGTAAFMNLMEVPLPSGLNVKQAVFCAIEGSLAGIFALHYMLPDTADESIFALLREKVGPVLATRDFNLIPATLRQRFKLPSDRMDFPPVERRRELSKPDGPHNDILTAVLCREGLAPFAETVVGARRLRRCVRLGAVVCCLGSLLGLLLAAYLTSVGAYTSLSPQNLLLFMLAWLVPVYFLTDLPQRY